MQELLILTQYNVLLIRYAEIWLKSQKVKIRMLNDLMNNIKKALERESIKFHKYQLSKDSSRVFFFFNNEDMHAAIQVILKVFGIHSVSPALRTSNKVKNIVEKALEVSKEILKHNESFAVRVKRSGNHEFTSIELAGLVGEAIIDNFSHLKLKVNLSSPDKRIFIEVRDEFSYIFSDIISSPWGGLPIESRKKLFVLDIGRLNDLTAGFLIMRRGADIHPILFKMTEVQANLDQWIKNWKQIGFYSPHRHFIVNMVDLVSILKRIDPLLQDKSLTCGLCRLLRFDIIKRLSKKSEIPVFRDIRAIVDGLNLNDMNDCHDDIDLSSVGLNHHFSEFPIFTPLVGFNQKEIEEIEKKISNNLESLDYCQFKPKDQAFDAEALIKVYKNLNLESDIGEALMNMKTIAIPISDLNEDKPFNQKK